MTARAIRVGVVLSGNLVEERLFADASPITVGQSLRCRLSVPADGVPAEHALFVRDQGRLLLRLTDQMSGRVAQGSGGIQTELRGTVAIERGARGKVQIGDATLLFQEVAAPAKAPRPQLPAAVRGTFGDRVDRRLATIVGASLAVHFAIGAWAWVTEVEEPAFAQIARNAEYRHPTHDTVDIVVDAAPLPQEPGAATPVAPAQTPAPIVKPSRIATKSTPKLPTVDDAERFANMLTTDEARKGGRTGMSNRSPGGELGKEIADIRDNNRTIGNDDGGFRNRPREGIGDGVNEHIVDNAPSQIEQQGPREEKQPGRIEIRRDPQQPTGQPIPNLILEKIRTAYMPGLMRCYKKGLVDDASLGGKVKVAFTVTETGGVADPEASGLTKPVDACIASQMATWRFPVSRDKDGDAIDLDVALTLALVPSN